MFVRFFLLTFLYLNVCHVQAEIWATDGLELLYDDYLLLSSDDDTTGFLQDPDVITIREVNKLERLNKEINALNLLNTIVPLESKWETSSVLQLYNINEILINNFPGKGGKCYIPAQSIEHPKARVIEMVSKKKCTLTISGTFLKKPWLSVRLQHGSHIFYHYLYGTLNGTTAIFDFEGPEEWSCDAMLDFFRTKNETRRKDDDPDGDGAGASASAVY